MSKKDPICTYRVSTSSVLPLYFLAEGMRVSLVSISSSSEILSTVVRYSITLVSRSGRREISKMCSMYDRLSAREVVVVSGLVHLTTPYVYIRHVMQRRVGRQLRPAGCGNKKRQTNCHPGRQQHMQKYELNDLIDDLMSHLGPACRSSPGS